MLKNPVPIAKILISGAKLFEVRFQKLFAIDPGLGADGPKRGRFNCGVVLHGQWCPSAVLISSYHGYMFTFADDDEAQAFESLNNLLFFGASTGNFDIRQQVEFR